jgi:TRAP transporter TAXI family solute receptor
MLKKTTVIGLFLCLALALAAGAQAADKVLSIATGGTAGTYYAIGGGMAKLISKYMPGYKLVVQSTGASIENCHLVGNKKVDFAIVMSDPAFFAYTGEREFKGKAKYTNIRGVMSGHNSLWQPAVLASSGIKSLGDLKGKKVALSAPGSTSKFGSIGAIEAYGVKPGEYKDVYLTYAEMVQAIKDGTIDCSWVCAGIPTSSMLDLTSSVKAICLPIAPDKFPIILKKHPYYGRGTIPANTYTGQTKDVPALSTASILITHKDVPAEAVYLLAKTIMDHSKELGEIHKSGSMYDLDDATEGVAVPFHPGAEKYLKEKGKIK